MVGRYADPGRNLFVPGRKAPLKSDMEYKVVLVDAAEPPAERPPKSKSDTILESKSGIH